MIATRRINEIPKSTNLANTGVNGNNIRGKYIFPSIAEPETRLELDFIIASDIYAQGIIATAENNVYGIPSVGTLATFPKIIEKIKI
jgi:hypothetical protein